MADGTLREPRSSGAGSMRTRARQTDMRQHWCMHGAHGRGHLYTANIQRSCTVTADCKSRQRGVLYSRLLTVVYPVYGPRPVDCPVYDLGRLDSLQSMVCERDPVYTVYDPASPVIPRYTCEYIHIVPVYVPMI